jgi:hypothetical protein
MLTQIWEAMKHKFWQKGKAMKRLTLAKKYKR